MKEQITKILNDETITTIEDRVDEIAKAIALITVPKDTYNTLSDKYKILKSEKETADVELNDLRKKNMTADELAQAKEKELADREAKIIRRENESIVEKLLSKNGITEETYGEEAYKDLVQDLVADKEEVSTRKTNSFLNILSKQKEAVEKETTTRLLEKTPNPNSGNGDGNKTVTKQELDAMTYSEEIKFAEENPELYSQLISTSE